MLTGSDALGQDKNQTIACALALLNYVFENSRESDQAKTGSTSSRTPNFAITSACICCAN
jgi:hypothetical protein